MNKSAKYIATVCYSIVTVLAFINLVDFYSVEGLIEVIAYVLIVVALLTSVPLLSAVSFGGLAVFLIFICVKYFDEIISNEISFSNSLVWIVGIIIYLLLMFASICTKYAKTFGILAAVAEIIRRGIIISRNGWRMDISTVIWTILFIVGALFIGIAYDDIAKKKSIKTNTIEYLDSSVKLILNENPADKILKLKDLLDKGIITKEEFEEKKKQVLNL